MLKTTSFLRLSWSVLLLMGLSQPSRGAEVFSSLGSTNPIYDVDTGWFTTFEFAGLPRGTAVAFTPAVDYTLTAIELALTHVSGANTAYQVSLRSDNSGAPGAILESWTTSAAETFMQCCGLTTVAGSAALNASTQYWVVVYATGNESGVWNSNNQGIASPMALTTDFGASFTNFSVNIAAPALRVSGDQAVPEPATLMISGLSLGLIAFLRRR